MQGLLITTGFSNSWLIDCCLFQTKTVVQPDFPAARLWLTNESEMTDKCTSLIQFRAAKVLQLLLCCYVAW